VTNLPGGHGRYEWRGILSLDGNSASAPARAANTSPSVFFAAPVFARALCLDGTDSIVFFIMNTDTISGPTITLGAKHRRTKGTAGGYPFQIWGSIFDADQTAPTVPSSSPAVSTSHTPPAAYAVNGEGRWRHKSNINGGTSSMAPTCQHVPSAAHRAELSGRFCLVQFNPHYVPHWRGLAYLVK